MVEELTAKVIATLREAAKEMTGAKRRRFQARVSQDYLGGDPRLTETVFGWSGQTVAKGLKELATGQTIPDQPRSVKPKTEDANPRRVRTSLTSSSPTLKPIPNSKGSSSTPA